MVVITDTKIEIQELNTSFYLDANDLGLDLRYHRKLEAAWNEVIMNLKEAPVYYVLSFVLYQIAYLSARVESIIDLSTVIYLDQKPIGIWPLHLRKTNQGWAWGSHDGPVICPLFVMQLSFKRKKKILRKCFHLLNQLGKKMGQYEWCGMSRCNSSGMDEWYHMMMVHGGRTRLSHGLYIDLNLDDKVFKRRMRKGFLSDVVKGNRLWDFECFDGEKNYAIKELQSFHETVAGRITRSEETWNLQEKAVQDGNAFVITIRDKFKKLIGSGLFVVSPKECHYATGVYDRSRFKQPLGHAIQMKAIEYMKKRKLTTYFIDERPYPNDMIKPSLKELALGFFKDGIATHRFPHIYITCPIEKYERGVL